MKKMNYSNFEDKVEIVPASSVEVVDVQRNESLPTSMEQARGGTIANELSPVTIIESIVNTALGTITDISKCVAMVSIEKQRTKQVEAQVRTQIEESIQQTNRKKIQEKESTKRLIIQCKTDLLNKKYELKKLREENQSREVELSRNHRLYIEQLDDLNKIVENIMSDKNTILQIIPDVVGDSQGLETLLHSLNDINTKLVEISKEIVELKKG